MKPICKAEARWKFWREENRAWNEYNSDKFIPWVKKQMRRARRRYLRGTEKVGGD